MLRKGYPFSPLLFTLVVDVIGRLMGRAKEVVLMDCFMSRRDGVSVFHLQL